MFDGAAVVQVDVGVFGKVIEEQRFVSGGVAVHGETNEAVAADAIVGAVRIKRVHDVDEAVLFEVVVEGHAEQPTIANVVDFAANVEQRRVQQHVVLHNVSSARVGHDEGASVRGHREAYRREDLVRNLDLSKVRRRVRCLDSFRPQRKRQEDEHQTRDNQHTAHARSTHNTHARQHHVRPTHIHAAYPHLRSYLTRTGNFTPSRSVTSALAGRRAQGRCDGLA